MQLESVGDFLAELKKDFWEDNKLAKVAELKKVEQRTGAIEEFI